MSIDKSLRQHYDVPGTKKIKGQLHKLAYITDKEVKALKKMGGIETRTPEGILAYPGHHGSSAPSGPSGPSGGGGGGGGWHPGVGSPAPAPAPAPRPHRDPVVTTAVAPPSILSTPTTSPSTLGDAPGREFAIATQHLTPTVEDYDYPGIDEKKQPITHHGADTPWQEAIQQKLDVEEIEKKEKFDADWDFEDTKVKAPKTWAPPIKTYDRGVPFTDKLIKTVTPPKYSPTYYQDRSKIGGETWGERAEDMMPRGGIWSAIGGGLKKIGKTVFGETPLDWLFTAFTFGLFGTKAKNIARTLKTAKNFKKSAIGKTLGDVVGNKFLKGGIDTKKVGDIIEGKNFSGQIAKGTGLESGAELLGLSEDEIKAAKLAQGVAHGGRIDKPLMGRNRYI